MLLDVRQAVLSGINGHLHSNFDSGAKYALCVKFVHPLRPSDEQQNTETVNRRVLTVMICVDSVSAGISGSSLPVTTWTLTGLQKY